MARNTLSSKQSLFVGITLFSMFFGAGNLIIPPLLGLQAGADVVPAMAGFLITGIGLPVLGIIAVGMAGDIRRLASRVHPVFASVFVAVVYLAIGPCLAIPRTSSTSFEMFEPLLPAGISVEAARLVFSIAFFAIAYLLAMCPGALTRLLGRVTGPLLIVLLVFVIGAAVLDFDYAGGSAHAAGVATPVMTGFLTGYQTMDLLASLTFGIVIATNVRELGTTDDAGLAREVSRAGVFAGLLMGIVYCGLSVVGLDALSDLPGATNGAEILAASAGAHFGVAGTAIVALIFLLACLNVCIGLISCCGSYFSQTAPRVPYRVWALGFAVFSCVVSNFGLDAILAFSVPLLNALYPMAIVLVLMGMMLRGCDLVPSVWPWVMVCTGAASIATALRDAFFAGAWLPFDALPFADIGMGWVLPALLGMAIGIARSGIRVQVDSQDSFVE